MSKLEHAVGRRQFVRSAIPTVAAAFVGMSGTTATAAAVNVKSVEIHSPDDCFVTDLFVTSGPVRADQLLLTLYSLEQEKLIERIHTFAQAMAIYRRKLEDGRRKDLKRLQEDSVTKLKEDLNIVELAYQ